MINNMVIQGRMVRDVELRRTNSGNAVASFTLAWSEKYKDNERKLFLPCVAWGNQAEFASKYFPKGAEVVAEGSLSSRQWKDKNGNNRETIELTVSRMHFCGAKKSNTDNTEHGFGEIEDDCELPF